MSQEQVFSPVSLWNQRGDETIFRNWDRNPFQDKRLYRLWAKLKDLMAESQCVVIHQMSKTWSEMASYYRFLGNKRIKVEEMIYHSCQFGSLSGQDVLVFGDTSSYNLQSHVGRIRDSERLGVVEDNESCGYFVQAMLAVDAGNEAVLGMADLLFWNRPQRAPSYGPSGKKVRKATYKMAWEEKETSKWGLGIENSLAALSGAQSLTFVFDQGADAYQLYSEVGRRPGARLVCRANYDRMVVWGDETLRMGECLGRCGALGQYEVDLPPLNHYSATVGKQVRRQARRARIELRCCAVGLLPPGKPRACPEKTLPFYLVEALEATPDLPEGEEPVRWRILTDLAVHGFEEAKRVVHIYTRRWMVEQLFRTTKSEGLRLEDTELESLDAIFKQAVMAFKTACKVLQLVYARNRFDSQPLQQVFIEKEIQVLEKLNEQYQGNTLAQQNPYPKNQASWAAWVIARMGGWKGYASKRPPGPITMLRGLEKLAVALDTWQLFHQAPNNHPPTAKPPPPTE